MKKSAREAAAGRGESTYQGADCPKGHGGERYTINASCIQCAADAQAARRERIRQTIADARAKAGAP